MSLRPIGTYGPVGASTTIYESTWICKSCSYKNFSDRTTCKRCKSKKPPALKGSESKEEQQVGDHDWREVLDPTSQQMYYYNTKTMETKWDRPEVMGASPYASGWFGRGGGEGGGERYSKLNDEYLTRPARKQKEHMESKTSHQEGNQDYNIWYGKHRGENWSTNSLGTSLAENRCVVATDSGRTKADSQTGKKAYFCIQYVRGKCARGSTCTWYHRPPTIADDGVASATHDCFGRERHKTHKDDMGGAGSFETPSRTLYVGRLRGDKWGGDEELKKGLEEQFGEFGEVEHINLISSKNIAFVRYRFRSGAEFGKEAMANQGLGKEEVLNVKWAHDDPNPVAQEAIRRADADAAVAALRARGVMIQSEEDRERGKGGGKRRKVGEIEAGGEGNGEYPDTDGQFEEKA